eukprot:Protomagalhaensia_sp_Gyna_25__5479@NODE_726_length_2756_cov_62_563857_g566_i0_p1_GENE_NODE_726_length_2756_cov_62_563857_g566_i0NODE_726_length_2756_cov_62_563857_g566_i0_p1_ORF_typecomplete_len504_score96_16Peptidase_M16_C/PF05193_21/2_8e08_NODE_726_length_2756_cov_62_563857_g566_i01771688
MLGVKWPGIGAVQHGVEARSLATRWWRPARFNGWPRSLSNVPLKNGGGGFSTSEGSESLRRPLPICTEATSTTRLNEKLIVSSLDTQRPSSTVGIFFNFGTLSEHSQFAGCTKLLEDIIALRLAKWKYREKVQVQIGPDMTSIVLAFRRNLLFEQMLPEFLALIDECLKADVQISRDLVTHYEKNRDVFLHQDASLYFNELMFVSSFDRFGLRFLPPPVNEPLNTYKNLPSSNRCPTTTALRAYLRDVVRPSKIVVAGCDVSHSQLVSFATELAEKVQDPLKSGPSPAKPVLKRGISVYPHPNALSAHASLLIDTTALDPGIGPVTPRSLSPTFLQFLLGGGDSFSSGGPGKGMFSRLQTRVLPLEGVETCQCFGFRIPGCSALGIMCDTQPAVLGACLQLILREVENLGNPVPVEELERIKNQMKFALWANFERAAGIVEELGRHWIHNEEGSVLDLKTFEDSLDSIGKDDIKESARIVRDLSLKNLTILAPSESLNSLPIP